MGSGGQTAENPDSAWQKSVPQLTRLQYNSSQSARGARKVAPLRGLGPLSTAHLGPSVKERRKSSQLVFNRRILRRCERGLPVRPSEESLGRSEDRGHQRYFTEYCS